MKPIESYQFDSAIESVVSGRCVILPTERWYMICVDATNSSACENVFRAKGRDTSKSLALICPDISTASQLFHMPSPAQRLANAFWPGSLALLLSWRETENAELYKSVGFEKALVNIDSGMLGEFVKRSSVPIAATTANFSDPRRDTASIGPAISVAEAMDFVEKSSLDVSYYLDGGISPFANHLTIVDCTQSEAIITRTGVIHERAIHSVLNEQADI